MDALCLIENANIQPYSKGLEVETRELANETLQQLKTAKRSVESLRSDGIKSIEAYNTVVAELEQSRGHVNFLEDLVCKLKSELDNSSNNKAPENYKNDQPLAENKQPEDVEGLKAEMVCLRTEVQWLRSALEAADIRYREEKIRSSMQIRNAYELVQQMKSGSILREAELEAGLKEMKAHIEYLKAEIMHKESQLQGIARENDVLNQKLKMSAERQRHVELENEVKRLGESVNVLRLSLKDKDMELQNALGENGMLKAELRKREAENAKTKDKLVAQLEKARKAERDANVKMELVMQEAEKSRKRIARVTEQLEAAQAVNSGMEAELRRLKVQLNQWRKAAEMAVAMVYEGNDGKIVGRTVSLDSNNYGHVGEKLSSFDDDVDDDTRNRSGVLKKIGVLWKKPQN